MRNFYSIVYWNFLTIALLTFSCTNKNDRFLPDTIDGDFEQGHIESIAEDNNSTALSDVLDSISLISGSCSNGRAPGDRSQYRYKMIIGTSKTDSISVRSDAACFNIAHCDHNILGKIKSGTVVYTTNSLKNRGGSAGIAYAFLVRDANGDTCRAYLSYLNFEGEKIF